MAKNISAIHNLHKIKRANKLNQDSDNFKSVVDKLIYVAAFAGPIMTIPQVIEIWAGKNASGVSFATWSSYVVLSFVWLVYGLLHKEKPIIFSSILWIVLDMIIVIGTVIYG